VNAKLLYLDSSAIVKLIVPEPESQSLLGLLAGWPARVSSVLARVEVLRALKRAGARVPEFRRGQKVLDRIGLIPIGTTILDDAARLKPVSLRSLDAIHLATALSVSNELAGIVTYDSRLAEAAANAKIHVWSPPPGQSRLSTETTQRG